MSNITHLIWQKGRLTMVSGWLIGIGILVLIVVAGSEKAESIIELLEE